MHIPPELDRLTKMNANEIRNETERLRGVTAMTAYRGVLIPRTGLQKKVEADEGERNKKLAVVLVFAVFLYFAYQNLM